MSESLQGAAQLQARLRALHGVAGRPLLGRLQASVVRESALLAPVKTGTLRRSIQRGPLTNTYADVIAHANYAAYVEFGTRGGAIITPKQARVLAWAAKGVATRATGRPTKGAVRAGGAYAYAMRVVRGATRAHPFMRPGLERAVTTVGGLADVIVQAWNKAP